VTDTQRSAECSTRRSARHVLVLELLRLSALQLIVGGVVQLITFSFWGVNTAIDLLFCPSNATAIPLTLIFHTVSEPVLCTWPGKGAF